MSETTAIAKTDQPTERYFKADNCLRQLAGQKFEPFSNIGSWWGAFKTSDPKIAADLAALCDPKNALWEITAAEYAELTKTKIEVGAQVKVPERLAAQIANNTATQVAVDIVKEDMAMKTEIMVDSVDEAVQVAKVQRPQQKPKIKPRRAKGELSIGDDIPKPNFDIP